MGRRTHLDLLMSEMGLSALGLSKECEISNSLISRWRSGSRVLTVRSTTLMELSNALVRLDEDKKLEKIVAPYARLGAPLDEAVAKYLTAESIPLVSNRLDRPPIQYAGEYTREEYVLLGNKGMERAAMLMLEYLQQIPPGQEILLLVAVSKRFWRQRTKSFANIMQRLNAAFGREPRFTVIEASPDVTSSKLSFAGLWIAQNLRGLIRGRQYLGDLPPELVIAVIPGYWAGAVEVDPSAEDGIASKYCADPRVVRTYEMRVRAMLEKCVPGPKYSALKNANSISLPITKDMPFNAIVRLPLLKALTGAELNELDARESKLFVKSFSDFGEFGPGHHRLILCREHMVDSMQSDSTYSLPLTLIEGKEVFVPKSIIACQIRRILEALEERRDFQVALVPMQAYSKIEIELVAWSGVAGFAWLQDGSGDFYDSNPWTLTSLEQAVSSVWNTLPSPWKAKDSVKAQLRAVLDGQKLRDFAHDQQIAEAWSPYPFPRR